MNLTFRFFDKESWSIYGVHKTFLIFMLFILLKRPLTTTNLILMSLLSMMEGGLIEKVLFTGFLILMIAQPTFEWVIDGILFVLSIVSIHFIPQSNVFQSAFETNDILLWVMRISSFLWMSYIVFKIITPFSKLL